MERARTLIITDPAREMVCTAGPFWCNKQFLTNSTLKGGYIVSCNRCYPQEPRDLGKINEEDYEKWKTGGKRVENMVSPPKSSLFKNC